MHLINLRHHLMYINIILAYIHSMIQINQVKISHNYFTLYIILILISIIVLYKKISRNLNLNLILNDLTVIVLHVLLTNHNLTWHSKTQIWIKVITILINIDHSHYILQLYYNILTSRYLINILISMSSSL